MEKVSDTESLEAETMATELPAQSATAPPFEDDEEEPPTPAPVPAKRGRPKGSKDAQPRTRTKPVPQAAELQRSVHTPSKQYVDAHDGEERRSFAANPMTHLEEAMANARQQEVDRRQTMYTSWLPY